MANLIFKDADKIKSSIMDSQKKEIAKLYNEWADEIGDRAKFYSRKTTASAPLSERYYKELKKQLRETSQVISNEIHKKIKNNIYTVSDAVVKENVKWLESFGFSPDGLNAAFSHVPDDVVRRLVTGQIYDSGWSLSKRIWGDNEMMLKDIYRVMAKGVAENMPIYEIAKNLEKYVRPNAALPWNLTAPDGVKIYKKQVDYNAQRLARTLVQHGYQQSFIATTEKNPFVTEYIWRSNGSRVCPICLSRDGQHFKKGELPMDHPNGMCTMEPVVVDDMVDQLANWFNSEDGTYPDIDNFAKNFGYVPSNLDGKPKTKTYNSVSMDELKRMAEAQSYNIKHNYTWNEVSELVAKDVIDSKTADAYLRGFTSLDDMNIHEYLYNYYVGTGNSFSINKALRGQGLETLGTVDQDTVKYMDLALNKTTCENDIELFRFLDSDYLNGTFNSEDVSDIAAQIGTIYENKQYMSSTIAYNPYFHGRPAIMRIQCERGTHVIPTTNYDEGEVILGRDTSYQLIDVIDHKNSPLNIEMDGKKHTYNGIEIVVKMLK